MEEIWKELIYHGKNLGEFYLVSNSGEIKGIKTGKVRKKNISHEGYYYVSVSLGSRKNKPMIRVHRAVAETFLENKKGYRMINHKDANKLNNNVSNLEFCTHEMNVKHAMDNRLFLSKKIICINTNEIFLSVKDANIWCGLKAHSSSISKLLNKKENRKTAGIHPITKEKLKWSFYND